MLIDRPASPIAAPTSGASWSPCGAADSFRRGHDPRAFEAGGEPERYDAVLATVPKRRLRGAARRRRWRDAPRPRYVAGSLARSSTTTALCVLLELDRPVLRFYWTNIADPTAVRRLDRADEPRSNPSTTAAGTSSTSPTTSSPATRCSSSTPTSCSIATSRACAGSTRTSRATGSSSLWLFREPAAQPIVTVGYRERIPRSTPASPGSCWRTPRRSTPRTGGPTTASASGLRPAPSSSNRSTPQVRAR